MTEFDCANEIMREQYVSPSLQDLPRALQELILLYAAPHDPFNMGARKKFGSVLIQVFYCGPNWKQWLGHPLIESVSEKYCDIMFNKGMFQVWNVYGRCTTIKKAHLKWTTTLATIHPGWRPASKDELGRAVWAWYNGKDHDITGHISTWDTSGITDMSQLFRGLGEFNDDIRNWDVSNVTNMSLMFYRARAFNQPLDNWNVSNVTNMNDMFYDAHAFNQPLNSWNVSNVTNMSDMFYNAHAFNQLLDNWNVSNVTDMRGMFRKAHAFNQPLDSWNVSNVTNMRFMFSDAHAFNQPLDSWNVSNVTDMKVMFTDAHALTKKPSWYK